MIDETYTLEQWIDMADARFLKSEIKTHLKVFECQEIEDVTRLIFISIRQWFERYDE